VSLTKKVVTKLSMLTRMSKAYCGNKNIVSECLKHVSHSSSDRVFQTAGPEVE